MSLTSTRLVGIEARKTRRAPVSRMAAGAVVALVSAVSIGGYAAATHSPGTDIGRKAAAMLVGPGWEGYTGLAVLGLGVSLLLCAGTVMAWVVGREFTDGTVVGLFAIPSRPGAIATAKAAVCLSLGGALALVQATLSAAAGIALGLPVDGAARCWLTLVAVGACVEVSALPVMWVATRWRGYLPGIGATLGVVVCTNLAAGFGVGRYVPWAIPVLWATPGSEVPAWALLLPAGVGVAGWWLTRAGWARLQLGRR